MHQTLYEEIIGHLAKHGNTYEKSMGEMTSIRETKLVLCNKDKHALDFV